MYHTQKCFESIASDITMSNLSNIPGGSGLPDRFRNVGDQIQQYFDLAETDPDRAVPFFVDILENQGSLTTRALALQGLGRAAQHGHVKQALADWEVLKDIAKEVKGKGEVSSDLTRWAAAKALEDIGYSLNDLQHLEGGGFTEPLDRIRREIRDRKLAEINRIQRLNTRGETTAEYDRNREFWLYGPVEELFAGNEHSPNYQELVKDVISELHGRGVYLGLISPNSIVQGVALREAELIFKESAEIEKFIYGLLEEFLHNSNHEVTLRITAAKIIHTATDLSRKLKTLSQLLLENIELRNAAVRLLTRYKQDLARVEPDAYTVLVALEYRLDQPHPKDLTIPEIETHISSSTQAQHEIVSIFGTAIEAAKTLEIRYKSSNSLVEFIETQQQSRLSETKSWIQRLTNQKSYTLLEQDRVKSYQSLLYKAINLIKNLDFLFDSETKSIPNQELVSSTEHHTYNQCMKLQSEFLKIKNHLAHILEEKKFKLGSKIDKINSISQKLFWSGICAFIFSLIVGSYSRELSYLGLALIIVATIMYLYYSCIILEQKNKKARKILDELQKK